jgi:hypothetical protein
VQCRHPQQLTLGHLWSQGTPKSATYALHQYLPRVGPQDKDVTLHMRDSCGQV